MPFPALTLLDNFNREELILNGGSGHKWLEFFPSGAHKGSASTPARWENLSASIVEGAYWGAVEYTNPAVAVTSTHIDTDVGFWDLWICVSNPTSSEISGYKLRKTHSSGKENKFQIIRVDKNVEIVLATINGEIIELGDSWGILAVGGKVSYWRKKGAGMWEEREKASDATYTKGFTGFSVEAADGDFKNFEVGEATSGGPTVENPGPQHSNVGRYLKLVLKTTHAKEAKIEIEGLPEGLSFEFKEGAQEITITGTPTKAETRKKVKIMVKGESGEESIEIEWIVKPKTSGLSMIIG